MSNKATAERTLQRLKYKMTLPQALLSSTTAYLGYNIGIQMTSDSFAQWIVSISGFVAGYFLYLTIDDYLQLKMIISFNHWSEAKINVQKKKAARNASIVVYALIIFTSTLSIFSRGLITDKAAGKNPVTNKTILADMGVIDEQYNKSIIQSSSKLKEASKDKDKEHLRADKLIENAIDKGGASFAKSWRGGNSWVRTCNKNGTPAERITARRREVVYKAETKAEEIKKTANVVYNAEKKRLGGIDAKTLSMSQSKQKLITANTEEVKANHKKLKSIINTSFFIIELLAGLWLVLIYEDIKTLCNEHKMPYGEPPLGIDELVKLSFNFVLKNLKIYYLLPLSWLNILLDRMGSNINFATLSNDGYGFDINKPTRKTNNRQNKTNSRSKEGNSNDTHAPIEEESNENGYKANDRHEPTGSQQQPTVDQQPTKEPLLLNQPVTVRYNGMMEGETRQIDYNFNLSFYMMGGFVVVDNIKGSNIKVLTIEKINNAYSTYKGRIANGKDSKNNIEKYNYLKAVREVLKANKYFA